ncbi:MAG: sugar kinase, partial [Paucimonas sp.]|nr:sugar kinase [Paucimonas sp.]
STGYFEVGGGTAANAAVAVARLGGNVAYWGRAGNDSAGHTMKRDLAAYNIDVTNFKLCDGAKSSISAVLVARDGERMIVNFRGEGLPDSTVWLPLDEVKEAKAVHADIRWVSGTKTIFTAARAAGIPTVLDGEIAEETAYAAVLPLTDHAIFSEPGLRAFAGEKTLTQAGYVAALEKLRNLGCAVAAVTRGDHGILWLDKDGMHTQASFPVEVVDTTGAGDVFHGAYALAIGEGCTVAESMRFSSAVSALKCTRQGGRAGIPTRAEVNAFLASRQQEPVPAL